MPAQAFNRRGEWGRMRAMTDTPHANRAGGGDRRLQAALAWLGIEAGGDLAQIAGDASFRRYFRLRIDGVSRILMDAPPELEDSAPFVEIAGRLRRAGLHAPEILRADLEQGFLLLEDLGDDLYRDLLDEDSVEALFDDVFRVLGVMAREVPAAGLPHYEPGLLRQELAWFQEYYLHQHRQLHWSAAQKAHWDSFCDRLVANALEQPQVFVHKDVHSCNLLRTTRDNPGVIDFQDAVLGPITYDFVSLVWDRYIPWPRSRIEAWMERFRRQAAPETAPQQWVRWCDLMGLQRNVKIVGRFALLRYAQGKQGYVEMIPRFYGYLLDVLPRYPEFRPVAKLLEDPACAP